MKIVNRIVIVLLGMAFVGMGCGHGQITDPYYGSGEGGSLISYTDPAGGSLEGGVIDPGKAIIATFESSVASLTGAMSCDGELIDIVIMPISDTQFSILPASGRFPQKTTCTLSLNALGASFASASASAAKAVITQTFEVGCDVLDTFDNYKTYDPASTIESIGTGCWYKSMIADGGGSVEMLDGMIKFLDVTGPGNIALTLVKRVNGDNFTVTLKPSDVVYEFAEDEGLDPVEGITYALGISDDITKIRFEGESEGHIAFVTYNIEDRYSEGDWHLIFKCHAGNSLSSVNTEIEGCGDGSTFPEIGLINKGGYVTPFYSFDGGKTKHFYSLVGIGSTGFDMRATLGAADQLDLVIMVLGDNLDGYGAVFIDDLLVKGDASLVK